MRQTQQSAHKRPLPLRKHWDHLLWVSSLLFLNLISLTMLWLADAQAFRALAAANALCSLLLFAGVLTYMRKKGRQKEDAFLRFLESPDQLHEAEALRLAARPEAKMVQEAGRLLRESDAKQQGMAMDLEDYEEYVEAWAHEVKTPISLLTFLLDNHQEEFAPATLKKLNYVQNQMQEYVSQMLYYARLKSVHKDYRMEPLLLHACCENVLEDYGPLLEEKGFCLDFDVPAVHVVSDQRGLEFLLRQAVSNSVKYCQKERAPRLQFRAEETPQGIALHIKDNGVGVLECDLPFLFEKGFTGDSNSGREKATGMGLYLAQAVGDDLGIRLEALSAWGNGFELILHFPKIDLPPYIQRQRRPSHTHNPPS